MSILSELSSQIGDRTEAANKRVAARVLKKSALLDEIASGLASDDAKLAGDCAEVMTLVAAEKPEFVVLHAEALIARLDHKDTRVRWEVMHSLAEIAAFTPDQIAPIVGKLVEKVTHDKSVIVRDYAIQALGEYSGTSTTAARQVWPHLCKALDLWEGKHVGKVLEAMRQLVMADGTLKADAQEIALHFMDHGSAKVRAMAKRMLK
jgi:hypothetical protein